MRGGTIGKILKVIALNGAVVAAAVLCYSPGLLALRPSDESIFRAGLSILMILVLLTTFFLGNYLLLLRQPPQQEWIADDADLNTEQAEQILHRYFGGKYFGSLAKTASEQITRLERSSDKALRVVEQRFEKGSLSWERYASVISAAEKSALKNSIAMANRMQLFDEDEYQRLQHYREDDIPDSIQEEKISLYRKNLSLIRDAIAGNEQLILKVDTLAMELADGLKEDDGSELLEEIERLTGELKYYK